MEKCRWLIIEIVFAQSWLFGNWLFWFWFLCLAQAEVKRFKLLLKYLTAHTFVKDVKLKHRLLPLYGAISRLINLVLSDQDLARRLMSRPELSRWVEENNKGTAHLERLSSVQSVPSIEYLLASVRPEEHPHSI